MLATYLVLMLEPSAVAAVEGELYFERSSPKELLVVSEAVEVTLLSCDEDLSVTLSTQGDTLFSSTLFVPVGDWCEVTLDGTWLLLTAGGYSESKETLELLLVEEDKDSLIYEGNPPASNVVLSATYEGNLPPLE